MVGPMPYFRVRVVTTGLAGSPCLSTFYFDAVGGSAELAAGCVSEYLQGIQPIVVDEAHMQIQNVVQTTQETTGNIIDEETIAGIPSIQGQNTFGNEWSAKQGLLAWQTGVFVDGKRMSARTFIPGVGNDAGEQSPTNLYKATAESAALAMITAATNEGCPMVAVRRPKQDPFVPGAIATINGATARDFWAVLRSRRQ